MILKVVRLKKEKDENGICQRPSFADEYYTIPDEMPISVKRGTVDSETLYNIWTDWGNESVLEKATMQIDLEKGGRCILFRWGDTKLAVGHDDVCYLMGNGRTVDRY